MTSTFVGFFKDRNYWPNMAKGVAELQLAYTQCQELLHIWDSRDRRLGETLFGFPFATCIAN